MGCIHSKRRASRTKSKASRTATGKDQSVKFSKPENKTLDDLVAEYVVIEPNDTENQGEGGAHSLEVAEIEVHPETEGCPQPNEAISQGCPQPNDALQDDQDAGTETVLNVTMAANSNTGLEDSKTQNKEQVALIKEEPATTKAVSEVKLNSDSGIEVGPQSVSIDLQDQIEKLEEKISRLNKALGPMANEHQTESTDSDEVDYETIILNLQDQISKLDDEMTQPATRKSRHGQQHKASLRRRRSNQEGMQNNLDLLLQLNETKWLKQTLEKTLCAIHHIPSTNRTVVKRQLTSSSRDDMADSAVSLIDSE